MKKYLVGTAVCLSAFLLAGCASSERMMRTSGGVFQDYSAPTKSRLTSGKFPEKAVHPAHTKRDQRQELGGIHDTLINVWPFFFRNRDYISCLWPMIDADPYGFAVRPFYNQEGDDYSILFPLTAWNPAKGHGWVFNTYWNRETGLAGVFPLFHHSPEWRMYSPLWITKHTENRNLDPYKNRTISTDFHLVGLLGYGKSEVNWHDPGRYELDDKLYHNWLQPDTTLAYKLAPYGIQAPLPPRTDKAAWDRIRAKVAESFVQQKTVSGGLFPLFGFETDSENAEFNILLGFPYFKKTEYRTRFSILSNLLCGYTRRNAFITGNPHVHGYAGETSLHAWLLLSGFETSRIYAENPKTRAFERLNKIKYSPSDRQRIRQELQIIDPEAKLPDSVVDSPTLNLFLQELQQKVELPTESYTTGGFIPLYFQHSRRDCTFRLLPVLLTWHEKTPHRSEFYSLPLLSWGSRTKGNSTTAVFWPMGYYRRTKEHDQNTAAIYSPAADPERQLLSQDKTFAACGLFHREIKTFYTAKKGYDAQTLEKLRQDIQKVQRDTGNLARRRKKLEERRAKKWPQKTKIEKYTYLIEQERIRLEEEAIGKEQAKLLKRAGAITRQAADAHVSLDMTDPAKAKQAVHQACTPLTRSEFGNLFFFNRIHISNGDYSWKFLLKLASGEGTTEREDVQILQFLYRHKRRGKKSETIYFPFVAIQKDGEDSRFRFLWRVFERTVEKGKVKGHILFIPYGE